MAVGVIIELNPANGRFLVAIDGGSHAVFTLYDSGHIAPGDRLSGGLDQQGSERLLLVEKRQLFEAFGEAGPASLDECRRLTWA